MADSHEAAASPVRIHTSVAVLINVITLYWVRDLAVAIALEMVGGPAPVTVNCPAANWMRSIDVPTGKATEALVGTVRVIAEALDRVMILPASVSTRV